VVQEGIERMSVGPLSGIITSAAGSSMALNSADVEQVRHQVAVHHRQVTSGEQAARAAGIAEPDGQDLETHDRDADGRRPWETPPQSSRLESSALDPPSQDDSDDRGQTVDMFG